MEENPSYSDNAQYQIQDVNGNLVGEILWENERGFPAFIFKGYPAISFQVQDSVTGKPVDVMWTEDKGHQNAPTVWFFIAQAQSFVGHSVETANLIFPRGGGLFQDVSKLLLDVGSQFIDIAARNEVKIRIANQVGFYETLNMNGYDIINDSDHRIKTNIQTDEFDVLEEYKNLNFIRFEYKDQEKYKKGEHWGLIAQDAPLFNGYNEQDDLFYINGSKQTMVNSMGIKQLKEENDQLRKDLETASELASEAYTRVEKWYRQKFYEKQ